MNGFKQFIFICSGFNIVFMASLLFYTARFNFHLNGSYSSCLPLDHFSLFVMEILNHSNVKKKGNQFIQKMRLTDPVNNFLEQRG